MKTINVLLILAVGWLIFRTETKQPNVTHYHQIIQQSQERIDSLSAQRVKIDTLIYENSNIVHGATRSERDSLRAILNPR